MSVAGFWKYHTRWGTFSIVPAVVFGHRRFESRFEGNRIGDYRLPSAALTDLTEGEAFSLPNGIGSSQMGLYQRFLAMGVRLTNRVASDRARADIISGCQGWLES